MDKIFVIGGNIGIIQISSKMKLSMKYLALADMACYAAKRNGNRYIYVKMIGR